MHRRFQFCLFGISLVWSLLVRAETNGDKQVNFQGPGVRAGYPDAFDLGYALNRGCVAPNGQLGVIYPSPFHVDRDPMNFIVDIPQHQLIGIVDTQYPYFSGGNHGGLRTFWRTDSSVLLLVSEGKWSPRDLVIIELHENRILRQTHILSLFERLVRVAIAKAKDTSDGSGDAMQVEGVTFQGSNEIHIEVSAETNPKDFPNESHWTGKLTATWSISKREVVATHVEQTSFRRPIVHE